MPFGTSVVEAPSFSCYSKSAFVRLFQCPEFLKEIRLVMKNVQINVDGKKLTIVVDLDQEFGLSSSGKSVTVASTEGNVSIPGHEEIKIGLNVYKPRAKTAS
jgi:hypothetical protein